jgi:hypothetical protein
MTHFRFQIDSIDGFTYYAFVEESRKFTATGLVPHGADYERHYSPDLEVLPSSGGYGWGAKRHTA